VNAQAAGPEVLDAARFPEIRLAPGPAGEARLRRAADGRLEGDMPGALSLHGRSRSVTVPVQAAREGGAWRVRGSVRFLQSDFGIEPYSGFLGTVGVQDEVEVTFDLFLVAEPGPPAVDGGKDP
jgi:polyisoprenoid-binding protein YceI